MQTLFPNKGEYCSCGVKLEGRQTRWASESCSRKAYEIFSVLKGNNSMIRKTLFKSEKGFCRSCGVFDENWEADHIIPVFKGGGFCNIDNFQTLCEDCHKEKTKYQMEFHRSKISSQAASIVRTVLLNEVGETV